MRPSAIITSPLSPRARRGLHRPIPGRGEKDAESSANRMHRQPAHADGNEEKRNNLEAVFRGSEGKS
ncbi:MAG: hypothetical protein D6679_14265 [Candidatus Hydrogenedentota bacterium]|nr:MAG: hypothetical protein D6679_14265 [Candidatus Hydrogenedentota bacterium]